MSEIDTSADAVERLALTLAVMGQPIVAATLRALAADNAELRAMVLAMDEQTKEAATANAAIAFERGMAEDAIKQVRERLYRAGVPRQDYVCQEVAAVIAERDAARAEAARLRETLTRWQHYGCPDCGGDCGSANPPVVCCIMRETSVALKEPRHDR